ncbi:CLUMA_CG015328, isoform A [Clunio marinus]|uniref:CLUMA_CG015328, isoform A n=1 Tax=Clunio marinus TaxID=568069 RepID=A0A1J1INW2_9DIPT|nr:CLUMA_CG015328, isoform A [Clunio marinus]
MMKILMTFLTIVTLETINTSPEADPLGIKYFVANPKSLDYKFTGKKDEHRFGVELKENKQFHHTKTAEDGVRLGCYGHEQDGKMYSTHYVADGKGYRLVPHQDLITVYPKDGGEARKASFVQSFNEEEIRSENIRYFFPEGCQSPKIEIEKIEVKSGLLNGASQGATKPQQTSPGSEAGKLSGTSSITSNGKQKKGRELDFPPSDQSGGKASPNQVTETPKSEKPTNLNETPTTEKQKIYEELKSQEISAGKPATTPPSDSSKIKQEPIVTDTKSSIPSTGGVTSNVLTLTPKISSGNLNNNYIPPINTFTPDARASLTPQYRNENKECSDTCCDDNRPQILLSRSTLGSCCKGVAKIVIPLPMETLSKISTSEIIEITSETSNIVMLEKLLKLVEKYKL